MPTETLARPAARVRLTEARIVALACLVVYLGCAIWFWQEWVIPGDSTSRLANAYYTLYSRDPHLAAVGFVWNPLPSLVLLPFLPLKLLFPALVQQSLLVVLVSAVLMTATVAIVHDLLTTMGVPRVARLVLTGAYALHPMTVLYAGNGMSEACFLLCLLLATHSLHRWLVTRRTETLVPLGLAVGLAYGARYEALAPVAAVPVVVALVTFFRTEGTPQRRWALARTDAVIAGLPGALSVLLWALASKLIVDQWFATFSSAYGNSAQVAAQEQWILLATGDSLSGRTVFWLQQLHGLEPLVLPIIAVALWLAWRRRDPSVLAPITVLGSVLVFDTLVLLVGMSFGWLRFQIVAVPGAVLLAGFVLASWRPRRAVLVPVLAATLLAVPSTVFALYHGDLAREEQEWITAEGAARKSDLNRLDARVAAELDAMNLPEGAVLTDAAYAYGVILASEHPRTFVITPDRDFPAALADPGSHGVRYLLVSSAATVDVVGTTAGTPARTWNDGWGNLHWTLIAV